jgi:hypothetical protein
MSISDKVWYKENQTNVSKALIDTYYNIIKMYV